MQSGATALVVAPPGRLRDGWQALLLATDPISDVRQTDGASSALEVVESRAPELVLLDADALGETAWVLLNQIKVKAPQCRCIALICSARQRPRALASGADAVLIKGFPAARLSAAVERLLS
jgi:DNA-binding NarL/FixJ family response regulator